MPVVVAQNDKWYPFDSWFVGFQTNYQAHFCFVVGSFFWVCISYLCLIKVYIYNFDDLLLGIGKKKKHCYTESKYTPGGLGWSTSVHWQLVTSSRNQQRKSKIATTTEEAGGSGWSASTRCCCNLYLVVADIPIYNDFDLVSSFSVN